MNNINDTLNEFHRIVNTNKASTFEPPLYTGVDLGTADIILSVIDNTGKPVAGAMQWAEVIRDGLIFDYFATKLIVNSLKNKLESLLSYELTLAGAAYPPGTEANNTDACRYICLDSGFEEVNISNEPQAAAVFLELSDGVVVDIGGGTTGISVLKQGKVIYSADEPTGGTHISLVIAGNQHIPFKQAEVLKRSEESHSTILKIVQPVIEKMGDIVQGHVKDFDFDRMYLAGGTPQLTGFRDVFQQLFPGVEVILPPHSIYVTPLGIARSALNAFRKEDNYSFAQGF